ncbi:peptide ABC transporter substrate-binding protein [Dietzia timorensis]|uniref:peptide ABC transporter substrate-binding protein n=1 Tax=Dietzia timorensis TaxID=499555 RepID=UPI001E5E3293|nr:ABC transporter substrate-binding protein [Dietzia timorensis]
MSAAALLAGTSLAACSSDGSGGGDSGDNVISAFNTEPQNPLIPTNTNEVGGGRVVDLLFEGLVSYDTKGEISNAVAEEITPNDDATEFNIKLKEGKTFSDGSPVTANSFVDAWNYGAASKNAQLAQSFFEPIEGFEAVSEEGATETELSGLEVVSDTEFNVTLSRPTADFPDRLGYSAFSPLPESAYDDMDAFGENPIGNGPYKLGDEGWTHNESIQLVPNEEYEGEQEPKNEGIDFRIYSSMDTAYLDVQGGQLDLMDYRVPSQNYGTYESDFPDSNVNQPAAVFQSFTIPERLEHWGGEEGKLRRKAISMAFDRDEITETIFEGTHTPAVDFTTPAIEGGGEELENGDVLQYNPDEAKKLWAEADEMSPFSGSLDIAYNADGDHQAWAEAVTNQIRETLGIESEGVSVPTFQQIRDDVTDRTIETAFRTGWQADYPSTMSFLTDLYRTGAGSNDGDYSSEEFDRLIDEAGSETDEDKRAEIVHDAQNVLLEDLPAIPLWYSNVSTAWNPELKDVEYNWKSVPVYTQITKN